MLGAARRIRRVFAEHQALGGDALEQRTVPARIAVLDSVAEYGGWCAAVERAEVRGGVDARREPAW
jgi:hypothetical protein